MGNLGQHVSYGHLHNSRKGDDTSARDIASLFVPAEKKSSNSADAKRKRSVAYIAPGKQLCQRFYLKKYVYNVNNETGSVIPKQLMHDLKPGQDEGKVTWYPEPHLSFMKTGEDLEEVIKGTFRSVSCSRSADAGTFVKEMCSSCSTIPNLPSFKKRLLLR